MNDLAESQVIERLATNLLGRPLYILATCGSTNDEVARLAKDGAPEGLVVASSRQTAGRGRRGRIWDSSDEGNLYFSVLIRPPGPATQATPLTLLAGLAVCRALTAFGAKPRLKWPNDTLLPTTHGFRKVAGVLLELHGHSQETRHGVLGVGINVGANAFPAELAEKATSLWLATGEGVSRSHVLATFLNAFETEYDRFLTTGPRAGLQDFREFALFGQQAFVERGQVCLEGVAEDIDDQGALLLRDSTGRIIPIHAGEVHWKHPL